MLLGLTRKKGNARRRVENDERFRLRVLERIERLRSFGPRAGRFIGLK